MNVYLTVIYVGNRGNSDTGKYYYSYDKDVILVKDKDTEINFILSDETPCHYVIDDLFVSDGQQQIKKFEISDKGRRLKIHDINTKKTLINFNILVIDGKRGNPISCDPQVMNKPPN